MKRKLGILGLALALPLVLTACVGGSDTSDSSSGAGSAAAGSGTGEVSYWLWDANQQPAYQACADAFHTANPDVTVKITQLGWDDYWTKLTAGFIAGTAPDVFTDHLSKYPEFVKNGQLLAAGRHGHGRQACPTDIYQPGLAELWVGQDGKRYGLPKDWDTIAVFYNKAMTDAAGLTAGAAGRTGVEPDRRRHLRAGDRQADRRRERRARRPARIRQEQRQDLRPRAERFRRRRRPDPVEHVHR